MRFSYHTEQSLPYPVEDVFAFFADPNNFPLLMPTWQNTRIEEASIVPPAPCPTAASAPTSIAAGSGTRVALSFRPFPYSPVRVRWQAEIAEFVWNDHFCDRQLRGPFAYWNHCHHVQAIDRNGSDVTLIVDHVEYELPFGLIGRLTHRLFLRRQIERTFACRQGQLTKILARVKPESPQSQSK
jgi:ligand-binding SRPBCC domain-containing protein